MIKKEIKEWTKDFEVKNKRVATNADKTVIDDKFVSYQMVI